MTRRSKLVSFYAVSLLMSACAQAVPASNPVPTATPAPTATGTTQPGGTPAPGASSGTSAPGASASTAPQVPGVSGTASLDGAAFSGAKLSAFQAGSTTPLATGTTNADGTYSMTLPAASLGKFVRLVATSNGKTLVSAGIVAQGGGNIVAQGGGNIVAQGGGNIVAQGGGNIVAQGGGNIVAQGAGNRRVLDVTGAAINLTANTTLTTLALSNYVDAASSLTLGDTDADALLKAFNTAVNEAAAAVAKLTEAQKTQLTTIANPSGHGTVPATIANTVTSGTTFATTFTSTATSFNTVISTHVKNGEKLPAGLVASGSNNFGTASGPAITPTTSSGGSGGGGSSGPVTPPATGALTVLTSFPVAGVVGITGFTYNPGDQSVWVGDATDPLGDHAIDRYTTTGTLASTRIATLPSNSGITPYDLAGRVSGGLWFTRDGSDGAALGLVAGGALASTQSTYSNVNGLPLQVTGSGGIWTSDASSLSFVDNLGNEYGTDSGASPQQIAVTPDGEAWVWTGSGALDLVQAGVGLMVNNAPYPWAGSSPVMMSAQATDDSVWFMIDGSSQVGHVGLNAVLGSADFSALVSGGAAPVAIASVTDGSAWVDTQDTPSGEVVWHLSSSGAVLSSVVVEPLNQLDGGPVAMYAEGPGNGVWLTGEQTGTNRYTAVHIANNGSLASFALSSQGLFSFDPTSGTLWAVETTDTSHRVYHLGH